MMSRAMPAIVQAAVSCDESDNRRRAQPVPCDGRRESSLATRTVSIELKASERTTNDTTSGTSNAAANRNGMDDYVVWAAQRCMLW